MKCNCFELLCYSINLEIITNYITYSIVSLKELYNYYINEVIVGRYTIAKLIREYICKVYSVGFLLNVGRYKYQFIIKKYDMLIKQVYGNLDMVIDKLKLVFAS